MYLVTLALGNKLHHMCFMPIKGSKFFKPLRRNAVNLKHSRDCKSGDFVPLNIFFKSQILKHFAMANPQILKRFLFCTNIFERRKGMYLRTCRSFFKSSNHKTDWVRI
jgi:hypothetical protein